MIGLSKNGRDPVPSQITWASMPSMLDVCFILHELISLLNLLNLHLLFVKLRLFFCATVWKSACCWFFLVDFLIWLWFDALKSLLCHSFSPIFWWKCSMFNSTNPNDSWKASIRLNHWIPMNPHEISGFFYRFSLREPPKTSRGKNAELGPCDDPVAFAQFAGILHLGLVTLGFFHGKSMANIWGIWEIYGKLYVFRIWGYSMIKPGQMKCFGDFGKYLGDTGRIYLIEWGLDEILLLWC